MTFIKRYLIPRLIQYVLVIFMGITAVFIIPRLLPNDPVAGTIATLRSRGTSLDPASMDQLINDLTEIYGLSGSAWDQYLAFWARLFHADFGVSFVQFPAPVSQLIWQAMPWTVGLLVTATAINWTLGNILGALAGYFSRARWSRTLDAVAMIIRPQPYIIFAFALLMIFAFFVQWFPISGGAALGRLPELSWEYIQDVVWHAFLPAMSLVILGGAVNFQTMKLIVQNVNAENFVQYAKLGGVREDRIVSRYVIRNAILPQITGLALALGQIFSGALITEIVFTYPGLGTLLFNSIVQGDYNLIMGITTISILAITTLILIIDLLYPFFDPRIRYQ